MPGKALAARRLIRYLPGSLVFLFAAIGQGAGAASLEVISRAHPGEACYHGSMVDVVDLVGRATALMDELGAFVAFRQMMDPGGEFINGDLYVFVLDQRGTIVANGASPGSVGSNAWAARDLNGHYFIREILQQAYVHGEGWIDYRWYSPCTARMTAKRVFFKRAGRFVVCVGYYDTLAI